MSESPKYDDGKNRFDLLDWNFIAGMALVLTFGTKKYAPYAWVDVPDARNRYFAAAMRHLVAWREGERLDSESGLPHLDHAACNLMFLAYFSEYDDAVFQKPTGGVPEGA